MYNGFVHDVEQDLNLPRPVIAGGTGATDAPTALKNLGGETASQVVTNFDSQLWMPGSFYAAGTATGSPVAGHAFVGSVVSSDVPAYPPLNQNVVVSARDQNDTVTPGTLWVREKKAGVWGSWTATASSLASLEVSSQVVTNFDTQLWMPGSFYSAGTAVNPPVAGHAFTGWAMSSDAPAIPPVNQNVVVYAYDQNDTVVPGTLYVRVKTAGVWGAWSAFATRKSIYAAPFDAMMSSNLILNMGMEVSQERGGASTHFVATSTPANGGVVDGLRVSGVGSYALDFQQLPVTTATGNSFPGFASVVQIAITTGQTTIGANDYLILYCPIEGYRINRLSWGFAKATPVTVGFVFYSSQGGTYSGSILNSTGTRAFPFLFTQIPGLPTLVTVTVPGDTTGSWQIGNSVGFSVIICLAGGSNFLGPPNAWVAGNYYGANGTKNGAVAGAVYYMTGMFALPGIEAPTLERLPYLVRPYDQELTICKRYYNFMQGLIMSGYSANALWTYESMFYPEMRARPSATLSNLVPYNCGALAVSIAFTNSCQMQLQNYGAADFNISFSLTLDARL